MSTNFSGDILLDPPLNEHEISYLEDFFNTRHVTRNHERLLQVADLDPNDVTDYNQAPAPMPSLWCDWMVDDDGDYLTHNGVDDSYHLDTWLMFLLTQLLAPGDDQALIHTHRGDDPRLKHFVPHIAHGVITAVSGDPHDIWTLHVGDLGHGFTHGGTDIARVDIDLAAIAPFSEAGKTVLLEETVLPAPVSANAHPEQLALLDEPNIAAGNHLRNPYSHRSEEECTSTGCHTGGVKP